ncbi:unnamed protein product [Cuscuta epithymum]|uniref:Uncharacterized protein n=1 Tax=Cuscuta epithymum TaxID=186058 RepID=A0AAV0DRY9_9ASTE|nr:unnamed protein product [Cuscuta epithymum]
MSRGRNSRLPPRQFSGQPSLSRPPTSSSPGLLHLPSPSRPSYASVLSNPPPHISNPPRKNGTQDDLLTSLLPDNNFPRAYGTHEGLPSITFAPQEVSKLVDKLQWSLIGTFEKQRPALNLLRSWFAKVGFNQKLQENYQDVLHT